MLEKLYYIASNHPTKLHSELVEEACEAGIRLIQLRMKNYTSNEVFIEAKKCLEICKHYNSVLIINDYIDIAKKIDADGVHLGLNDEKIENARIILGENKIIGGTANSYDDIVSLIDAKVNYIGLGPYKFTNTKEILSPILGLEGYENIISKLKKNKIDVPPIYAIGGIELNDVHLLMQTKIYGIAVSSLLTNSFSKIDLINSKVYGKIKTNS